MFVIANGRLRKLVTDSVSWARAIREWYRNFESASSVRETRGLKLLREWLSSEQLAQYDRHSYFDVIGCHSGKRYRIRHGVGANIYEIDDAGRPRVGWCFVPQDNLVAGDVVLAQKISLETDERGALAVAKSFALR